MELKEFFETTGIKKTFFCKKAGITYDTIYRVFSGRFVTHKTATKIVAASEGKVDYWPLRGRAEN